MDVVSIIIVLGLGTLLFFIVNRLFDIFYFGCAAVTGLWFACVVAGLFLIEIIINHWIISLLILIALAFFAFRKS